MNLPDPIHVYCMPGMAANPKIFDFIRLPEPFVLHKLSWLPPHPKESLEDYVSRLTYEIKHPNPVLLGVSFGGLIVQELARKLQCRKVIIISSVKSYHEFPLHIRLPRKTKAYRLFPTQWVDNVEDLIGFVFGPSVKKQMNLHKKYLSVRSESYLNWALEAFFQWNREQADPNVLHIHGNFDVVLPVFNIKNYISVPKGTHVMILNRASWFNQHLPKLILDN